MSKPVAASLRVPHRAGGASGSRTSVDSVEGCTCKPGPTAYTFHRDRTGKTTKRAEVRDRLVAERALRELLLELDEERRREVVAVDRTLRPRALETAFVRSSRWQTMS